VRIPIDHQSPVSLYQQIETYLRDSILSGKLPPETRLPASRELADDLGVSRTTVENAYAELEAMGIVVRHVGKGTYVPNPNTFSHLSEQASHQTWPLWQQDFLDTQFNKRESGLPHPAPGSQHPNPISFTGFGDPGRFPVSDFHKAIKTVIQQDGIAALGFGDSRGYAPLRVTIASILASQGIPVYPDSVLITSGSQQAIALVTQLLLKPGDTVLVEKPTYDLGLDLLRSQHLKIVGCPTDEGGMQVEQLEPLLQQHHPKLIYTIPDFQNPTGMCLSLPRRRQLITLADRYNIPILEDDFAGDLRYDGYEHPALKTLDPGGRVIYIGTFSKMLMPGLRIGFLIADGPVYNSILHLKRVSDLATSTLIQHALEAYITVGRYQAHLRRSRHIYRKRRDAMLKAIATYLPKDVQVIPPQGGLFIWLRLPEPFSSLELLPIAARNGVDFAAGPQFFLNSDEGQQYLRLNFAVQTPANIEEGVKRLGNAIKELSMRR